MKIKLRWCPVDKKPTLQAHRRGDYWGRKLWYCPQCGRCNQDISYKEEAKKRKAYEDRVGRHTDEPSGKSYVRAEPEDFRVSNDWRDGHDKDKST